MSEVIKKLADPTLRWYVSKLFGTRVYGDVTVSNQTLYICDELICIPARFSEYLKWWDPVNNAPGNRMFDKNEAWDHVNESNPSTAYPLNGKGIILPVFNGYFIAIDLTDGTNRVVVHIVRKKRQILVVNMGYYVSGGTKYTINIPVKVYFPPTALNYVYVTNGTIESDGVVISSGQYVLFYPYDQNPEEVDTTNGLFKYSPAGSNPSLQYELEYPATPLYSLRSTRTIDLPKIYTGIRIRSDTKQLKILIQSEFGYGLRSPINVSGIINYSYDGFKLYDSDPYASAGTWAEDTLPFAIYVGWAEDQNGNAVFYLFSSVIYKHTTKKTIRGKILSTFIYDMINNEQYVLALANPIANMYSYGRGGAVTHPFVFDVPGMVMDNCVKAIWVKPDDTYGVKTADATACWEWNDGYGYCNVYNDRAICFEYLAFYTDDTNISITDPKNMGMNRCNIWPDKRSFMDQMKPYMDRTLYAGKNYFVLARVWVEPLDLSDEEYANRIKKYAPKVLTSNEWSNLVTNIPPYSLRIFGIPETARVIYYTYSKTVTPGSNIILSGSVTGLGGEVHANKKIKILIIDQQNNIVTQTSTYTDGEGNFSINLTAPQTTGNYKVVIIATNEEQPIS